MFSSARQTGLTLVELVVAICVVTIIVAIAVPGFKFVREKARMSSAVNDFVASLHMARSQAITDGQWVALCPSSGGQQCDGSYTAWADGYIAYVDLDRNKRRDDDEPIVAQVPGLEAEIMVRSSSAYRVNLFYRADGRTWESNTAVRFCSQAYPDLNKAVIISASGRPRLSDHLPNGGEVRC